MFEILTMTSYKINWLTKNSKIVTMWDGQSNADADPFFICLLTYILLIYLVIYNEFLKKKLIKGVYVCL